MVMENLDIEYTDINYFEIVVTKRYSESINFFNLDRETPSTTFESSRSILLLEYLLVTTISK